jgi:glucokinase
VATTGTAIGIDVGGTKIHAFRVRRDGSIEERRTVRTPIDDHEEAVRSMIEQALAVRTPDVVAVGVGVAGLVDANDGILRFSPNVSWRELPIASQMRAALELPVQVDNDANVAAWGEWRFGAGRSYRHMLLVTVGTGIGGGVVAGRRLFRGAHGFGGEIGHVIVDPNGPLCGCGNRGCWETVASGQAVGRLGREAAREHPRSLVAMLAGGDPEAVTGVTVTAAAHRGDPIAHEVFHEVGRRLGEGIAGLVNVLDPQIVVVGGGLIAAGDILLDPAREACERAIEGAAYRARVPIVPAELGNDAGAVGAASLAFEELGS